MLTDSPAETGRLEKYVVLRPLAAGGMAELFLVRSPDPAGAERVAVIKRLHRRLALEPEFVEMFLGEARIASTLRHPNVVEVFDVGEEPEQCYIAMEHLHGHDLRDTMARVARRGPLRLDQALSIARAVAAGLHYTHEQLAPGGKPLGIVHRDVSPHNVLLTYDGRVKIVDFGVAKASTQLTRTRTGILKGKVAYMSPEQAMGAPLDRRSDVFCIGILLWEMTTGKWLYRRRSELETLNAVVHNRPPRPSRVVADYPRDLERLVMKTLARSRNDRWYTAGELVGAIDALARRHQLVLGPEPVRGLMASAFGDELAAWHHAQSLGVSLADHLIEAEYAVVPPSEEDLTPSDGEATVGPGRRRLRRWWPAITAVAAAGIAAAWIAHAVRRGPAAAPVALPVEPKLEPVVEPVAKPPVEPVRVTPPPVEPALEPRPAPVAKPPLERKPAPVRATPPRPAPPRTRPVPRRPPTTHPAPPSSPALPPIKRPPRTIPVEDLDKLPP